MNAEMIYDPAHRMLTVSPVKEPAPVDFANVREIYVSAPWMAIALDPADYTLVRENLQTAHISTAISTFAFQGCRALASVDIGEQCEAIGSEAFCNCTSLERLEVPDSVDTIGDDAFKGSALKHLSLPAQFKDATASFGIPEGCEVEIREALTPWQSAVKTAIATGDWSDVREELYFDPDVDFDGWDDASEYGMDDRDVWCLVDADGNEELSGASPSAITERIREICMDRAIEELQRDTDRAYKDEEWGTTLALHISESAGFYVCLVDEVRTAFDTLQNY